MKTEESLECSVKGRINAVEVTAMLIADCASELRQEFDGGTMADMRGYLSDLTQQVHEYNCYYNCLHTD